MNGKEAQLQISVGKAGCPNDTVMLRATNSEEIIVLKGDRRKGGGLWRASVLWRKSLNN